MHFFFAVLNSCLHFIICFVHEQNHLLSWGSSEQESGSLSLYLHNTFDVKSSQNIYIYHLLGGPPPLYRKEYLRHAKIRIKTSVTKTKTV